MLHKRTIIILTLLLLVGDLSTVCYGQTVLSLDSCRAMALRNNKQMRVAEENLRTANLGFAEGVITPTTVMEAQTAWLQAQCAPSR